MSDPNSLNLFHAAAGTPTNVVDPRRTGILPYQQLVDLVRDKFITSLLDPIDGSQIQPASIDLRLGRRAYRVRASFLPGPEATVMERVKELDGLPAIDLEHGAVLERGVVYIVELMELIAVALPSDMVGMANPKSSTGRLDILTRLITDRATAFDKIDSGYKGSLYLEIAPLTYSVVVRRGSRLGQVRFHRGAGLGFLPQTDAEKYYRNGQFVSGGSRRPLREGGLVPVTVDLKGARPGLIVGYTAKNNTDKVDVDKIGHYDPRDFWDPIVSGSGRLNLDHGRFYILATSEDVGVPRQLAAEMVPFDTQSGEFRVHYAGFFDPGFGLRDDKAAGSKAVLEVRSYGVSFTLEHGQIIGWLRYARLAGGFTTKLYGADIASNYQGQGVALAKQFKKWVE